MGRVWLAIRAFFLVLFRAGAADAVRLALASQSTAEAPEKPKAASPAPPPKPVRSEALTLLAALQREGRLVDFLKEPITGYSDAQIGAAVREVHRGCAAVIDRWFDLKPVVDQPENSRLALEAPVNAARIHVVGSVAAGASAGIVRHAGWEAARCDLPQWTGTSEAARIVAPAEIEVS